MDGVSSIDFVLSNWDTVVLEPGGGDLGSTDTATALPAASGLARARAERAVLNILVALHVVYVGQALLSTATGWSAYRRGGLVLLLLTAIAIESAFVLGVPWRSGSYLSSWRAWAEVAFAAAVLIAMVWATSPPDRTSFLNWAEPFGYAAVYGAAIALRLRAAVLATVVLMAVYAATISGNLTLGGSQLATGAANLANYVAFLAVGRVIAGLLRGQARELDEERGAAVGRERLLGVAEERDRQHRFLHDSALQTLEAIAQGWGADAKEVQRYARWEAIRLRSALGRETGTSAALHFADRLAGLVQDFAADGLAVELLTAELEREPPPAVSEALADAAREALRNVVKHAGVDRAVVRAVSDTGGTELTVRDHGRGFDAAGDAGGFGIVQSIKGRLDAVGGRADVWSAPGRGTRVHMWGPK